MGIFLLFLASCISDEYNLSNLKNDNMENMFVPECVNTVYFNGAVTPNYWLNGVEPQDILDQFVEIKDIEAIHTRDHALHGFSYGGESGEGIIVRYHNVPRESSSLGTVFGYHPDADVMISSWTRYEGDYQSLATVYILFPIEDGLVYYNKRQVLGYDRWFEPGLLTWKADQYFYGLPTDLGEHLRACLEEYDNFLYGPIGSQIEKLD